MRVFCQTRIEFRPISTHTLYVDAADLLLHWTGINLTHVATAVGLAQLLDAQPPRAKVLVSDAYPCVVRDNASLQRQHGLIGSPQPADLDGGMCV